MKVYRDSLLKMECHPGGDWHPGKGDNPNFSIHLKGVFFVYLVLGDLWNGTYGSQGCQVDSHREKHIRKNIYAIGDM